MTKLRATYRTAEELRDALEQMSHGGVLVKTSEGAGLAFDAAVELELVLPDGGVVKSAGKVLQVLAGLGVAVTVDASVADEIRRRSAPAREPAREPAKDKELSNAEKIQLALHGNRDQRMAILRDPNRTLHPYVLKNPQTNADDILTIVKNNQISPELFKQIAERKEWFQRPQIALAIARNPKAPPDLAVRALDFVGTEALRQFAKGVGAPPHVVTAARKKVIGK